MIDEVKKGFLDLEELLDTGKQLYGEIEELTKNGLDLVILPEHLGDSVWTVSFAEAYKRENQISSLYFVCPKSQGELVQFFPGVDGVVTLTSDEMNALKIFVNVVNYHKRGHIRYGHYRKMLCYNHPNFGFQMMYEAGLTLYSAALYWLDLPNGSKASRMMEIVPEDKEELKNMFQKSILLFPNAQSSFGNISDGVFEMIASFYKEKGYEVYTNYNGFEYESVVPGTEALSSTMIELASMAPYFAQVIGVRSGAMDLLAHTNTNLSIIYDAASQEVRSTHKTPRLYQNEVLLSDVLDLVNRDEMVNYQFSHDSKDEFLRALFSQVRV
ncbi:MAG: hypothetical protein K6F30_09695 [Lachnospiraceae bacterium]|nr:hypothetical protein [Lachnospiraceae bacterium]